MRPPPHTSTRTERHLKGALFVLMTMLAVAGSAGNARAAGTVPDEATAQYQTLTEPERVRLLIKLAKSGEHKIARQLMQQFPLQGEHAHNRTLYIEGLILRGDGKLTAATDKFRAALADDPKLTLVRSDLAETLYALEQDESAKHHLKLLESEAPNEQAALGIRSFIEEIDTRRPYTVNAYVALAPTSNINNGTRKKTVYSPVFGTNLTIDDESREKSAVGVAAGINGSFNRRLGDDLRAIISGNIEARVYDDSDFNSLGTSEAFELRRTYSGGHLSLGAVSSQDFSVDDQEMSFVSYGPRIAVEHGFTPQDYVNASALFEWRDYRNSDFQDAEVLTLNAEFTHAFDSTFTMSASAGYINTNARENMLSYDTWTAGLSGYREFSAGITVNAGADVHYSKFDEMNLVSQKTREDVKLIGTIALTKRDFSFFGIAPSLQYTYIWNQSNISLYDYDSHSIDLKFTKAF
jgi:outer membrane protein